MIKSRFVALRATVHIQVNDINEYSPVFKEKSYKATVIEGKKYDSILKVEAVDADCSFQFSQICNYEIVTPDVPFTVDKDGRDLRREMSQNVTQLGRACATVRLFVSSKAKLKIRRERPQISGQATGRTIGAWSLWRRSTATVN